jgi:hypothetical protein
MATDTTTPVAPAPPRTLPITPPAAPAPVAEPVPEAEPLDRGAPCPADRIAFKVWLACAFIMAAMALFDLLRGLLFR